MRCSDLDIYREIKAALSRGESAALATVISADAEAAVGAKALYLPIQDRLVATWSFPGEWLEWALSECKARLGESGSQRIEVRCLPFAGGVRVALEVLRPPPRLVIAGGGHIAQAVHTFAAQVGFSVTVIDDRPAFANRERFPHADEVICDAFSSGIQKARIDAATAVAVVTRGHRHDVEVLAAVAPLRPRYVGMIGSRRRVVEVIRRLQEMGVPQEFIDGIYAPIGLDIGAESPEEIGLAIVAEILCVLRGRSGGSLRWRPAARREEADDPLA